jgi:hypothetical protein
MRRPSPLLNKNDCQVAMLLRRRLASLKASQPDEWEMAMMVTFDILRTEWALEEILCLIP